MVWDQDVPGQNGVHLWSADHDGSHARRIFTSHRGFTLDLVLDRRGRRVAFAPCCKDSLPRLVVVPVDGGRVRHPLARYQRFYAIGGIGWSPRGDRLVFEGYTERHHHLFDALWIVRLDGRGLRRVVGLPDPRLDSSMSNEALAWTRRGVLYCEGGSLRVVHHGRSRVLVRGGVYPVRISGDGRHIVTEHDNRVTFRDSIWYGDADGRHQRRLWLGPAATTSKAPRFGYPVLDFHGRQVLVERQDPASSPGDGVVRWRVGSNPDDAPPLGFLANADSYTWN